MTTITAILSAYNEEISIGSVVLCTSQHADRGLVIDDGSTDRSTEMAEMARIEIKIKPQINTDEHRYLRDFSLFSGRSGKPPSTQRDAEKNNNPLRSSASSAVNHNHSSFYGGVHMTVTITALWDQLYFHSDTDIHGFTQINGFNNIINIFQPEPATRSHQLQPQQLETIP